MHSEQTTWWRRLVERYEKPHLSSSVWQIINSIAPYLGLWALMAWTVQFSYLLTLLLVIPTAGFWIRIFIICHDCGHGSFFANRRANHIWGAITGLMTLVPYRYWRLEHARHHGSSGNLDRRGIGDIWTMTIEEYRASSWSRRLGYRLYRNPFIMFGVGSFFLFAVYYRFTAGVEERAARRSVYMTNIGLLILGALMVAALGWAHFLMIFVPLLLLASSAGVWLFYVQHQFEGVYWERDEKWDYLQQAMEGSSFYRLPRVLQWFTGNIGFHHIHHLSHRIPNYNLPRCHFENELFQKVPQITLRTSLKSLTFRLWDERQRQLVGFSAAR